eukprot:g8536.t1
MGDDRRNRLEQIAGVRRIQPALPKNRQPLPPKAPPPGGPKTMSTHINQSPSDVIRDIRLARARGSRGGGGKKSRTPNLINRHTLGMTDERARSVIKQKGATGMPKKKSIRPRKNSAPMPPQRCDVGNPGRLTMKQPNTHDMLPIVKDEPVGSGPKPRLGDVPAKLWRKGTPSLKTVKHGIIDTQRRKTPKPKVLDEKDKERKIPRKFSTSPVLTEKVNHHKAEGRPDMKNQMANELMMKVFKVLDCDGGGHIDAAELQRGLEMLQVDSTLGAVKEIMKRGGHGLDGTIDFETFKNEIGGKMRGGHIGQMRSVRPTFKDENREMRISNKRTAKAIGDLRGSEYNNTSLFAAGYQRFRQAELYKPHLPEHQRRPKTNTKNIYDKEQAKWIKRAQSRVSPRPSSNMSINSVSDPSTYIKQIENEKRITKLRRQLNNGGASPEKQHGLRWGGENRFAAADRIQGEREEMHRLDQQSKMEEAKRMNDVLEKEAYNIFQGYKNEMDRKRKTSRRTPTVWNKLIAGEPQHI